jgi:hypothetical protein
MRGVVGGTCSLGELIPLKPSAWPLGGSVEPATVLALPLGSTAWDLLICIYERRISAPWESETR